MRHVYSILRPHRRVYAALPLSLGDGRAAALGRAVPEAEFAHWRRDLVGHAGASTGGVRWRRAVSAVSRQAGATGGLAPADRLSGHLPAGSGRPPNGRLFPAGPGAVDRLWPTDARRADGA